MGQEQSANTPPEAADGFSRGPRGIQLVEGSGSALQKEARNNEAATLLRESASLPLPQPLLPRSEIQDSVASALQATKMMHELRTLLGGLLDEIPLPFPNDDANDSAAKLKGKSDTESSGDATDPLEPLSSLAGVNREVESRNQVEREAWSQIGIDPHALDKMITDCTGGTRMSKLVDRQTVLLQKINQIGRLASRLKSAVDIIADQARKTTKAMEILDRLSMSITDLHDSLEQAVATANILGAAHFAEDEEMSSFKSFLKHNPPQV